MTESAQDQPRAETKGRRAQIASASTNKAIRITLLAMLLQVTWPTFLAEDEIVKQLPFYGESPTKAFYRDLQTLTGYAVEELPSPSTEEDELNAWCIDQRQHKRLAIVYDRDTRTFGLACSAFTFDIREDEARAFTALRQAFSPGVPYAEAVQSLLKRWEWLFSEHSHRLVVQKSRRLARPVLLPLSPATDYSGHTEVILKLDEALETGTYISFAYTPQSQSWDSKPVIHHRVEPYELEYRDGHWYFTAFVFERNNFLDYRIDRIHPGSVTMHDRFLPGNRKRRGVKIRYWLSPEIARHGTVSDRLSEQRVDLLTDNQGAIVEGYARSLWWARRLLLGYGQQVKALDPEELVESMRAETQAMARRYAEET